MNKPEAILLLAPRFLPILYSKQAIAQIQRLTLCDGQTHCAEQILADPEKYAHVRFAFSGWSSPRLDAALLQALPRLEAYFFAAGTVRYIVSDAFWQRKIHLTSAYRANAIPVAEFTVASIVLSLKRVWAYSAGLRGKVPLPEGMPGVYSGSRVGIVSLGAIGRLVCRMLSAYRLDVIAYDPYAADAVFEELSVARAGSLEAIFSTCDVVSLHTPSLAETKGMVSGSLLEMMPQGATLINTARGAIVDEQALLRVLQQRPDLCAVLDVITDESAYASTPLLHLPNVLLTPHIAGSGGRECHRLGDMAVEECRRYLAGEPALVPITEADAVRMA